MALSASTELAPVPSFQTAAAIVEKRPSERRKEVRDEYCIWASTKKNIIEIATPSVPLSSGSTYEVTSY